MNRIDRILIKVILTQFLILLLSQVVLHQWNAFPELKQLTKYEGVNKNSVTEFLQTFSAKKIESR
jgi:hypothetical protein